MKKLLFVIPSLDSGGAEKSLVNLLNTIDKSEYSVDLYLFSQKGVFLSQLPDFVNILSSSVELAIFQKPLISSVFNFLRLGKFSYALNRLRFFWTHKKRKNSSIAEQQSWQFMKPCFDKIETLYDAAIGFLEKSSIYFVVDKTVATKKIGFIHTYYSKLDIDVDFEENFFSQLTSIAVVSRECSDDLKSLFPAFSNKIAVVHNILLPRLIKELSLQEIQPLSPTSIISIGRLVPLKGFDMAVEAAAILRDKKVNFHWYIIGEGSERRILEQKIRDNDLENSFTLLGLKENPYPYIRKAKIFVQPSLYEGKSIAVDEAKILAKPIVLTNFPTAKDQIEDNVNGLICDMNSFAIADSILQYLNDTEFTSKIIKNLTLENLGAESEVEAFYRIING